MGNWVFFQPSEDREQGSEKNIMILFPRGRLQVPFFFQTSGILLEEENNDFLSILREELY